MASGEDQAPAAAPRSGGGASRTVYTIDAAVRTGRLWVWGDDDDTLFMEDADGVTVLAVWPDAEEARVQCAADAAAGEGPVEVALDRFVQVWLPQLEEDGDGIAIYPVGGRIAVTLTPAEFRSKVAAARRAATGSDDG